MEKEKKNWFFDIYIYIYIKKCIISSNKAQVVARKKKCISLKLGFFICLINIDLYGKKLRIQQTW